MIKLILFDLGGVLFTNGTKQFIEYLHSSYGIGKDKLSLYLDKGELPDAYREGKINRAIFWSKVKDALNLQDDIDSLEKQWIQGYELIQGTKDIIQDLKKKYRVYYLSDNVKERVDAMNERFQFLDWFEDGVFSHEVGVRKPNPKIYEFTLKKAMVNPSEVIFIDDKESSLIPARALGITTILFQSPESLRIDLKNLALL